MRPLVWFRVDLRMRDNPALHAACTRATKGVVGVYLLAPEMWRVHDDSPNKIDFARGCLRELSESLARRNIPLLVRAARRAADAPGALLRAAREHRCNALFFNNQCEFNEARRDDAVEQAFARAKLGTQRFCDQTLIAPGTLQTADGNAYRIFTPFYKAWLRAMSERDALAPLGLPRKQSHMVCAPDRAPDAIEGFEPTADLSAFPPGERAAHRRLKSFLSDGVGDYADRRDVVAIRGTSRLSPYLTSGALSLRQCVAEAAGANRGRLHGGKNGLDKWICELAWREFYRHLLVALPRLSMHRPLKTETDRIPWRDDEAHLQAWKAGRTGYPIVDAGMRQLAREGWMHNRARMIVAMFLSKDLLLDWRLGERHFMQHLIDGDLASNNGGWQWSASTGADSAPYFRIFNPTSQSRRHDPDGVYIRKYVEELGSVRGSAIHEPDKSTRMRAGYANPIVDHSVGQARAIEAFKRLKAS